jgi:ABC-2 type transport system ATP-binding protein
LTYVAWLQGVPARARATTVATALSKVGLASRADFSIKNLSGGMRRRLGIGHAIIHEPALLLLDEPTAGLDPRQRVELRKTITSLSGERIIIVATHLVEDIRGLAQRIILLSEGTIVYDGDIVGLEQFATPEAPGDSDLERAIANLMGATA